MYGKAEAVGLIRITPPLAGPQFRKAKGLLLSGTFSISKIFHPLAMPILFFDIGLFPASNFIRPLSFKVTITLHKKFLCVSNNIGPTIWPNTSLPSITKFHCWTSCFTTVHPKNAKTKLSKQCLETIPRGVEHAIDSHWMKSCLNKQVTRICRISFNFTSTIKPSSLICTYISRIQHQQTEFLPYFVNVPCAKEARSLIRNIRNPMPTYMW